MNLLQQVAREQVSARVVDFNPGDEVRVHVRIKDGEKVRIQVFEGTVIARRGGNGPGASFVVRKVSFGVGVERIFPIHTPSVEKIEIKARHSVRRARLYFLRGLTGKAARLKEGARLNKEQVAR